MQIDVMQVATRLTGALRIVVAMLAHVLVAAALLSVVLDMMGLTLFRFPIDHVRLAYLAGSAALVGWGTR